MWQKRLFLMGVLLGVFLTLSPTTALAQQSDPVTVDLHVRISRFFEQIKSKTMIPAAYQELLGSGPKQLGSDDDRKDLVAKTAQIEETYGAYRGFEPVYTKRVGGDLVFVKYLYKCDRFPVLWHVAFYRSSASGEAGPDSGTWRVVSIRFDTDLEMLTLLLSDK